MRKFVFIFGLVIMCASCSFFTPDTEPEAVARVDDSYLYKDDISNLVPEGTSKEDSAIIVKNHIDRWASKKLLIKAAEMNLNAEKQAEFDILVQQYKIDLYTTAYIEEIVKREVDTVVSEVELENFYRQNKENFKTNGVLVRLRYIKLKADNPKYETIKSKFFDFRKSDEKFWDTYALQFKNFALNDSVWVEMSQVYNKLPFINPENRDKYIIAGKAIQHQDSTDRYLVKITNVIGRNNAAPFEFVKPTLKEVILNKRKMELIKKFEKDIIDDAVKNKKYEIYK